MELIEPRLRSEATNQYLDTKMTYQRFVLLQNFDDFRVGRSGSRRGRY